MPINSRFLQDFGRLFIVVAPHQTIGALLEQVRKDKLKPNQVFLVIQGEHRVAMLLQVLNYIETNNIESTALVGQLPLSDAVRVIPMDTPESAKQIQEWLGDHADETALVVEGDTVRGVLHNPLAGVNLQPLMGQLRAALGLNSSHEDEVMFSAYHAHTMMAEQVYGLYVYVHTSAMQAEISKDIQAFESQLGGSIDSPTQGAATAQLKRGAKIWVDAWCDDLEVVRDEPSDAKVWEGKHLRFNFKCLPTNKAIGKTVKLHIRVYVGMVLISAFSGSARVVRDNPFNKIKIEGTQGGTRKKIFVSYAHADTNVVESFEEASRWYPFEILRDVRNLSSGDFRAGLVDLIKQADTFMLFWSSNSAKSDWVRYEWEHMLDFHCNNGDCGDFFQPVYWQTPMPPLPDELKNFHFRSIKV